MFLKNLWRREKVIEIRRKKIKKSKNGEKRENAFNRWHY